MKITSLSLITLLVAGFCTNFLVSCKKSHQNPVAVVDSLKVGLLAYYTFNNTGADSSGNKNDGTVYDISSTTDRFGNPDGAYFFNGTTSYISIPDNQSLRLNNTDFTLNVWVKTEAYSTSYAENILTKRINGPNNGWLFCILGDANSPTGVIDYGSGGAAINSVSTTPVPLDQWHMLTVIYTVAKLQTDMYMDGTQISTVTGIYGNGTFTPSSVGVPTPDPSITALMYIGKDDPSEPDDAYFFNGSMDDVRIYKRAISKDQIQQLFTANE